MVTKILITINTLVLLLYLAPIVSACVCTVQRDVRDEFTSVDAAFVGKVTDVKAVERAWLLGKPRKKQMVEGFSVTFDVSESFRGTTDKTFTLFTYGESGMCDLRFREGETYLVFATKGITDLTLPPRSNKPKEMQLQAEIDEHNRQLPVYSAGSCSWTGNMRFESTTRDAGIIRSFSKNWKPTTISLAYSTQVFDDISFSIF